MLGKGSREWLLRAFSGEENLLMSRSDDPVQKPSCLCKDGPPLIRLVPEQILRDEVHERPIVRSTRVSDIIDGDGIPLAVGRPAVGVFLRAVLIDLVRRDAVVGRLRVIVRNRSKVGIWIIRGVVKARHVQITARDVEAHLMGVHVVDGGLLGGFVGLEGRFAVHVMSQEISAGAFRQQVRQRESQ